MKRLLTLTSVALALPVCAQLEYVDPFIGTGGHGHTYPGATAPFGMMQLSPDTRLTGWDGCSGYHYSDTAIYGFSHTHLSGTGVSDYGDLLLMPLLKPAWQPREVAEPFAHANEFARPGEYGVRLKNGISVHLAAAPRSGVHSYTFPEGTEAHLLIDLAHRDRVLEASIVQESKTVFSGYRHSDAWARNQRFYFYLEFSEPVAEVLAEDGENLRRVVRFGRLKRPLTVWVGISAVDEAGARANAKAEVAGKELSQVLAEVREAWKNELGKITVEGTDEQKRTFYTAHYHTQIVPNLFSDVDGRYRGMDDRVHEADGPHYTVFSLWDTYRAAHPLYTLIDHERTADFLRTFDRMYTQYGRLPVWELAANETNCMIGYHAVSVLADAAVKGLSPLAPQRALEMAAGTANAPVFGLEAYREKGYLDVIDEHESVSKTLEYGYNDYNVALLASLAQKPEVQNQYQQSSLAYRNLLDENGFMHPRRNGTWLGPFDPREVNSHFTEANSWQYSFYVPHDLQGFMDRLGGPEALEKQLNELFTAPQTTTGRTQPDISGLIGQYAHGNEPSHHIVYLYNSVGKPHKTQERVRQILTTLYHDRPDGLSGNEDCGQMSAWYVLSSLGFYPVCPGDARYAIGYPLFDRAEIRTGLGRTVVIKKSGSGNYISEVKWNGNHWPFNYLIHPMLMVGGELEFVMSNRPSSWGTAPEHRFLTAVDVPYATAPVLTYTGSVFKDSMEVGWENPADLPVLVRIDRGNWQPAADRLLLTQTCRLDVAFQQPDSGEPGCISTAHFYHKPHDYTSSLVYPPNRQYTGGGNSALTNGITGSPEWRKGDWVGIQGQPLVTEIDLKGPVELHHVGIRCLQDSRSWILHPQQVTFYGQRTEGGGFEPLGSVEIHTDPKREDVLVEEFSLEVEGSFLRLRVEAQQFGTLPDWHQGFGSESFIFADEVVVR